MPSQVGAILEGLTALQAEGDDRLSTLMPLEYIENVVSAYLLNHEGELARDDYHLLIRAFRVFDPEGKGYVLAEQMRSILSARGEEPLTEDELNKMIGRSADENGKIFCECHACIGACVACILGHIVQLQPPLLLAARQANG